MPELTPDLIVDLKQPTDLDLSPDGRQVAYALRPASKREEHLASAIWIAPVDASSPPRQFTAGQAEDRNPRWSPDGQLIAFLSDRAKRGTAQLYLIPANGGEARPLTSVENKKAVEEFAWSPDGRRIAFTCADEPTQEDERREKERDDANVFGERQAFARLRVVDIATGEVTTLVDGDRQVGGPRWSSDGASIAYAVQRGPALEYLHQPATIERVAAGGGAAEVVCGFPVVPQGLSWSMDGAMLFFVGTVAGGPQSSGCIYAVPAAGGEPRRVALGEESCGFAVETLADRGEVVIHEARGLGSYLQLLDPRTGRIEPLVSSDEGLDREFWRGTVRSTGEGVGVALVLEGGDAPPEVWGGRAVGSKAADLRQITHHQTSLDDVAVGRQEAFHWRAPDGMELDGILIRPPSPPEGQSLPTIVLVHGGPYGRSGLGFHVGWSRWGQWLATAGYLVLMPNPRGGLGHGEAFAAAARGDLGGADFRDVMSMVDAAVERGLADPERLGIGGWSQGGYMTAWAVTQTDRFKAGVMGAGVSDWGMMVMTSDLPDFERSIAGSAPWEGVGPLRHAERSPISFAGAVTTPLLILHGEKDARVPVSQAIGFHRALRERNVPTQLVVYPREPHGIGERAHQIDVLRRVRDWYGKWV